MDLERETKYEPAPNWKCPDHPNAKSQLLMTETIRENEDLR